MNFPGEKVTIKNEIKIYIFGLIFIYFPICTKIFSHHYLEWKFLKSRDRTASQVWAQTLGPCT